MKLGLFYSTLIVVTAERSPWAVNQLVARPIPTWGNLNRIN
jgi:hypothetical protein